MSDPHRVSTLASPLADDDDVYGWSLQLDLLCGLFQVHADGQVIVTCGFRRVFV